MTLVNSGENMVLLSIAYCATIVHREDHDFVVRQRKAVESHEHHVE